MRPKIEIGAGFVPKKKVLEKVVTGCNSKTREFFKNLF
jgi:hypothetical protein